jgi:hypothetical protein
MSSPSIAGQDILGRPNSECCARGGEPLHLHAFALLDSARLQARQIRSLQNWRTILYRHQCLPEQPFSRNPDQERLERLEEPQLRVIANGQPKLGATQFFRHPGASVAQATFLEAESLHEIVKLFVIGFNLIV